MFDHFPFALQKTRKVTTKNANTQVNEHFYEKLIDSNLFIRIRLVLF
jgi:hypothetical protein